MNIQHKLISALKISLLVICGATLTACSGGGSSSSGSSSGSNTGGGTISGVSTPSKVSVVNTN